MLRFHPTVLDTVRLSYTPRSEKTNDAENAFGWKKFGRHTEFLGEIPPVLFFRKDDSLSEGVKGLGQRP